jgi:hypothetical protein
MKLEWEEHELSGNLESGVYSIYDSGDIWYLDEFKDSWGFIPVGQFKTLEEAKEAADKMVSHPLTPAKGQPMPRTIEYYIKRGDMDQELIMEQKEEISRLKQKVNNLRQRIISLRSERDSQNVNDVSIL